jgi:preprotein translocase subunit SecA
MIMDRLNIPEDVPIESKMVSRAIRSAQTQVEAQNFEIRKNVLKYDEVLNRQRTVIYDERRKVLGGADLHEQIANMVDDVVEGYVLAATAEGYPDDWDLEQLWTALKTLYPITLSLEEVDRDRDGLSAEGLIEDIREDARAAYVTREESVGVAADGEPVMRELERRVLLSVMDRQWREHLYEMDYLQEGIGLRAMGQRDPLVEYQREGFDMFHAMMDAIKEEAVGFLFNVEVQTQAAAPTEIVPTPAVPADLVATGPGERPGEVHTEHLTAEPPPPQTPVPAGPAAPEQAPDRPSLEKTSGPASPAAQPASPAAPPAPPAAKPTVPISRTVLPEGFGRSERPANLQYTAPSLDSAPGSTGSTTTTDSEKPSATGASQSRNSLCACGSGRKYKRCHGDPRNS